MTTLAEAVVGRAGNDDVVDDPNAQKFAGPRQMPGQSVIVGRGRRIAGRVVVGDNDTRRLLHDSWAKDFGWSYRRFPNRTLVHEVRPQEAVTRVQRQDPQLLMSETAHLGRQQVKDLARMGEGDASLVSGKKRGHLGGRKRSKDGARQVGQRSFGQSGKPVEAMGVPVWLCDSSSRGFRKIEAEA
ncbi:MAG: hypothetical protein ABI780_05470 [Ardenticatenales bacterium]